MVGARFRRIDVVRTRARAKGKVDQLCARRESPTYSDEKVVGDDAERKKDR